MHPVKKMENKIKENMSLISKLTLELMSQRFNGKSSLPLLRPNGHGAKLRQRSGAATESSPRETSHVQ